MLNEDTKKLARQVRIDCLRMTSNGGSSHIGSCFSSVDILAVLYGKIMNVFPDNPEHMNRDRFIMSKGHAGASVYATLARTGFFDVNLLKTHYQNGSILSGHVSHKNVPGVEFSSGSLGHGLSVSVGIAHGAKLSNENYRSYCLLSDGECDEGSIWEAALFASHHKLDNLIVIIDNNKIQSLDFVENTMALEPFADKWEAFGWEVCETDGHDHKALYSTLNMKREGKPFCILAHTTKGKGVSFMENSILWHYRTAKGEEFDAALEELENAK